MRPFSAMVQELLAIAVPGLRQMATNSSEVLNEHLDPGHDKETLLKLWDEATSEINHYWSFMTEEKFHEKIVTFGQYEGTVCSSIFYFIDNEIHHRAQGYVYLRSIGIEPPFFWER
jgi:uncharacterized damage-inducible protein DinB